MLTRFTSFGALLADLSMRSVRSFAVEWPGTNATLEGAWTALGLVALACVATAPGTLAPLEATRCPRSRFAWPLHPPAKISTRSSDSRRHTWRSSRSRRRSTRARSSAWPSVLRGSRSSAPRVSRSVRQKGWPRCFRRARCLRVWAPALPSRSQPVCWSPIVPGCGRRGRWHAWFRSSRRHPMETTRAHGAG
jgi:hypothetical protein